MPDGDKIHNLPRRYTKVYKQICEGRFTSYDLAHEAASPLIADIKEYGNGPVKILEKVLTEIKSVETGPLYRATIKWKEVQRKIQVIVRAARGHKRGCEIAAMASQDFIGDLQQSDLPADSYKTALISRYIRKIFALNFEECLPVSEHHDGADHDTVLSHLADMQSPMDETIEQLANQLSASGAVDKLRRPNHHNEPIGLDDDLLA